MTFYTNFYKRVIMYVPIATVGRVEEDICQSFSFSIPAMRKTIELCCKILLMLVLTVSLVNGFELCVFPLRKQHKFPTDELTLNLYETRYLQLAERVLQSQKDHNNPIIFGAFYCSGKPQMVRLGKEPITPMIDKGDIGVICQVLSHEEGMVPRTKGDGNDLRRRIRIESRVIGRFLVKDIIQNGYGGGSENTFLLVDADRVEDVYNAKENNKLQQIEHMVHTLLIESPRLSRILCLNSDESMISTFSSKMTPTFNSDTSSKHLPSWAMSNEVENDRISADSRRRMYLSFSILSGLVQNNMIEEMSMTELESMIRSTSTSDRLKFVLRKLG